MGETVRFGRSDNQGYTFKNNMNMSYEQRDITSANNGKSIKGKDVIGGYQYPENPVLPATKEAQSVISIVASSSQKDEKTEISTDDLSQLYKNFKAGKAPAEIKNMTYDEDRKNYSIQYHTSGNNLLDIKEGDYWMSFSLPKPAKAKEPAVTQTKTKHSCPSFLDDPFAWLEHRWLCH